jgi:hypothetical protein
MSYSWSKLFKDCGTDTKTMNEKITEKLKKELEERISRMAKYIKPEDIPDRVKAKITSITMKKDTIGNDVFEVELTTEHGDIIIQQYTVSTWQEIYRRMSLLKWTDAYITWKKQNVGRAINPRLLPEVEA